MLGREDSLPPATQARINAALANIDQLLLDPQGLPGRPWFKNLVYAPGTLTGYGAKTLPGVREGIEEKRYQEAEKEIAEFTELGRSILTYGLPDFTSFNLAATDDRMRVRRCLEDAITNFEPRLRRVRVSIEPPREHDRALRFRVDALLRTDPSPEPVMFDMVLQLNTQEYVVQGRD